MLHRNFTAMLLALATSACACGTLAAAQTSIPRQPALSRQTTMGQAVQKDVPAEFRSGIAALASAKSSLEKAGDRWGGHRVKAIHLIDEALNAVGQPQAHNPNEMKSGPQDEPAALESGISSLNTAKSDFERSGNQWGGRREKALAHINQALSELQIGIEYAKSHHTY